MAWSCRLLCLILQGGRNWGLLASSLGAKQLFWKHESWRLFPVIVWVVFKSPVATDIFHRLLGQYMLLSDSVYDIAQFWSPVCKYISLFTCKDFCSHFISSLQLFCISSPIYDSFVATLFRSKSLLNMFPLFLLPFCIINSLQFLCGNYCLSSLDHQFSFSHDAHDNLKNYFKCLFMIISSWIPSSFIEMLI